MIYSNLSNPDKITYKLRSALVSLRDALEIEENEISKHLHAVVLPLDAVIFDLEDLIHRQQRCTYSTQKDVERMKNQ